MTDATSENEAPDLDPPANKRKHRPRPPITGIPNSGEYQDRLIVPNDFDEPLEELRDYMEEPHAGA